MLGTKGEELADRVGWVVTGTEGRLGEGLATERLLNTAETPSPNSRSGDLFLGVFHNTPSVPGRGRMEGFTMVLRLTISVAVRAVSLRSRKLTWLPGGLDWGLLGMSAISKFFRLRFQLSVSLELLAYQHNFESFVSKIKSD